MKRALASLMILLIAASMWSITEKNDYLDPGLVEKSGTFNINRYLFENYLIGFASVGSDDFSETGAKVHTHFSPAELKGFFVNGDIYVSKITGRKVGGDAGTWWGGNIPYFGETNFGFKSKYFDAKLGFQNIVSSDTIYNHLMIDDYSGAFFAYTSNLMITRYFDFQAVYNFIRFHQSAWYTGVSDYSWDSLREQLELHKDEINDGTMYQAKYGKSQYFHKVNLRPAPWIRFGFMESVFFLGENFNPYFANPFFLYFATGMIDKVIAEKTGSSQNVSASDIKYGLDFTVGFDGWKLYGEMMIDDANGEYITFKQPDHPDRVAFLIGGELRGYLFDKYLRLPAGIGYFIKNLYINTEFAVVSRYTYSRDGSYFYEYVREEYPYKYYPEVYKTVTYTDADGNVVLKYPDYVEYSEEWYNKVNRIGNYIGYMYGSNSDSFDIAIGWRNDLPNVDERNGGYIADRYFESMKKKEQYNRLFKIQFHFRRYRLGEYRDVVQPFYLNEHFYYDLNPYLDSDGDDDKTNDKTNLRTGFIENVVEDGRIFDFSIYTDIIRINRVTIGVETKNEFKWIINYPDTSDVSTEFSYKLDFAIILGF